MEVAWDLEVGSGWSLGFGIWDLTQSYRRATIGSTRDARRAGRKPASADTAIMTAVAATIVMASVGARPKSRVETKRPAPREPATPIAMPIATSTIDSTKPKPSKSIVIDEQGDVSIDGKTIDLRAVRAHIEQFRAVDPQGGVVIIADRNAPTGTVVAVADQSRLAGILDITFTTTTLAIPQ